MPAGTNWQAVTGLVAQIHAEERARCERGPSTGSAARVRRCAAMHIVELLIPGVWLDHPDKDWAWRIGNQVTALESPLVDAALALSLFEAERARPRTRPMDRATWEREGQRRREIEDALCARLGIDSHSEERWTRVRELAEIEHKREQWAAGKLPFTYEHRLVFLHARSFLLALDRLDRSLAVLVKEAGVPAEVEAAHAAFRAAVPNLRGVRNSVAHHEDRSRGLGRDGKPLSLKPVVNEMVSAPGGGVLMLENLFNNRFGSTMDDGHYGEVEVSVETLRAAAACVQRVMNTFSWKGPRRHSP